MLYVLYMADPGPFRPGCDTYYLFFFHSSMLWVKKMTYTNFQIFVFLFEKTIFQKWFFLNQLMEKNSKKQILIKKIF